MRRSHGVLVDGYAKPRFHRYRQESVYWRQHLRVGDEAKQVVPDVIVDAERHFLKHDVRRRSSELKTRCERQRAQRTVRRNGHVKRLGKRGDAAAFAQAARVAEVGLDNVDRTGCQERLEVPAR